MGLWFIPIHEKMKIRGDERHHEYCPSISRCQKIDHILQSYVPCSLLYRIWSRSKFDSQKKEQTRSCSRIQGLQIIIGMFPRAMEKDANPRGRIYIWHNFLERDKIEKGSTLACFWHFLDQPTLSADVNIYSYPTYLSIFLINKANSEKTAHKKGIT